MENKGVPTAESPTAKMEVVPTAESPNNNQTFPTRPNLDQRFAENEGVPTAESPTAKMEVVPTADYCSITKKRINSSFVEVYTRKE